MAREKGSLPGSGPRAGPATTCVKKGIATSNIAPAKWRARTSAKRAVVMLVFRRGRYRTVKLNVPKVLCVSVATACHLTR